MFIIHRIVFFINFCAVLLLLASYLAPYISPTYMWLLSLVGISYTLLLLANILFVIYWLIFFKFFKIIYSLAAIAIGFSHIQKVFKLNNNVSELKENTIKVMSFNGNYFGVYSTTINSTSFFEHLKEENPDIFCFQEFMWENNKRKNYIKKTNNYLPGGHVSFLNVYTAMDTIHREYGMFIYTKFPIVNTGKIEFENTKGNCVQWVDVKIKNETFRIYNVHLQSIKFDERDYDIMKLNGNNDTIINKAESIMLKMKEAWQVRAKQAELLKDHIESCPHKIILCGDFNDTPISYTYNTVVGNLKDAFIESGSGFSQTYSGRMPSFRIDYILADKSFDIYNYELGDKYWSDHKLVQTTLHIKK